MDGFADRGLDESNFGSSDGLSVVQSFDAFRMCNSLSPQTLEKRPGIEKRRLEMFFRRDTSE